MPRLAITAGLMLLATPATAQITTRLSDPCPAPVTDSGEPALPAAPDTVAPRPNLSQSLTEQPDVVLFASVYAREVRFDRPPRIRVRLCWGGDTLRVVERRNLPSPVQTGVSYRDVSVAVELLGRINAECLLASLRSGDRAQPDICAPAAPAGQRR